MNDTVQYQVEGHAFPFKPWLSPFRAPRETYSRISSHEQDCWRQPGGGFTLSSLPCNSAAFLVWCFPFFHNYLHCVFVSRHLGLFSGPPVCPYATIYFNYYYNYYYSYCLKHPIHSFYLHSDFPRGHWGGAGELITYGAYLDCRKGEYGKNLESKFFSFPLFVVLCQTWLSAMQKADDGQPEAPGEWWTRSHCGVSFNSGRCGHVSFYIFAPHPSSLVSFPILFILLLGDGLTEKAIALNFCLRLCFLETQAKTLFKLTPKVTHIMLSVNIHFPFCYPQEVK